MAQKKIIVKDLIKELQKYDENLIVVIHHEVSEEQGFLQKIHLVEGIENCPYDKGDDIYSDSAVKDDEKVLFLTYEGIFEKIKK